MIVNMMEMSHLQYLSKTFTCSSKVTLPNIRKGLVKVTFPSHLQYLNGSLSKSLRSLKVYFRAVIGLNDFSTQWCSVICLRTIGHYISSLYIFGHFFFETFYLYCNTVKIQNSGLPLVAV